jgi:NAD(P)H-hydrate epimerase
MELAGLAVAQISESILHQLNINKVCVLVGPGNNGGDGLVAARHLKMMNYAVDLVLFKTLKGKCENLYKLCECNGIKSKIIDTDFGKPETP